MQPDNLTPNQPATPPADPTPPAPQPVAPVAPAEPVPPNPEPAPIAPTTPSTDSSPVASAMPPQPVISQPSFDAQPAQAGMTPVIPQGMPGGSGKKRVLMFGVAAVVVIGAAIAFMLMAKTPKVSLDALKTNFKTCTKSYNFDPAHKGDLGTEEPDATTTINGKHGNGCSVTLKFGKLTTGNSDEKKLSGTTLTCVLDDSKDLDTALDDAFENFSKYDCKGSFVTAFNKLKDEITNSLGGDSGSEQKITLTDYTNSDAKFSMKIPKGSDIKPNTTTDSIGTTSFVDIFAPGLASDVVNVTYLKTTDTATYSDWLANYQEEANYKTSDETLINSGETTVAGHKAYKYTKSTASSGSTYITQNFDIYVDSTTAYEIEFDYSQKDTSFAGYVNTMISSFKVIQ